MLLNNVCNKVKEQILKRLLREKCPNTKYLSVFSPYSMRENTDQKKLHIWTLFTQLVVTRKHLTFPLLPT